MAESKCVRYQCSPLPMMMRNMATNAAIKDIKQPFCRDIFNFRGQSLSIPDDIYEKINETQHKSGFIPSIFLILLRRPDEFRAFFSYYDALMKSKQSELSNFEKEMIVVATSSFNKCLYCVVAHGAMLRVYAKKEEKMANYNTIADQIATDYTKADITDKQKAMLEYAVKLATKPYECTQKDIDGLLELGFSKEAVWDIGAITSLFAASNRIAHFTALMPNHEFYEIGRLKQ